MVAKKSAAKNNTKVTKEQWLNAAYKRLVAKGVTAVKVAKLAAELDVSRSSFYWYFTDRDDLLQHLVSRWREHNIDPMVQACSAQSETLTEATLHIFDVWANPDAFDEALELAIRAWAGGDAELAAELADADALRISSIAGVHERFGHAPDRAIVLARVHFLSQIGRYTLGLNETWEQRSAVAPLYVEAFTGVVPSDDEVASFKARIEALPSHREVR